MADMAENGSGWKTGRKPDPGQRRERKKEKKKTEKFSERDEFLDKRLVFRAISAALLRGATWTAAGLLRFSPVAPISPILQLVPILNSSNSLLFICGLMYGLYFYFFS